MFDSEVVVPCVGLNPCPFCGSNDVRLILLFCDVDGDVFSVQCPVCETLGPRGDIANVAYQAWNQRSGVAQ